MTVPRELLSIRDELAKKVAERQLDRGKAVADLCTEVRKYPDQLAKLADDWADTEIDRSVKRYITRRNKTENAAIIKKLAELGMSQPTLDGDVPPISQEDESYKTTLADYGDYISTNLSSSWRLLSSFEKREEDHELLVAAVDGDPELTREQALDVLREMPSAKRKLLRSTVKAKLASERQAFLQQRYGEYGQAAEG